MEKNSGNLLARLWVIYPLAWINFETEPQLTVPLSDEIEETSRSKIKELDPLASVFQDICIDYISRYKKSSLIILNTRLFLYDGGYGYETYIAGDGD